MGGSKIDSSEGIRLHILVPAELTGREKTVDRFGSNALIFN